MIILEEVSYRKKRQYLVSHIDGNIQIGDCITLFGPNGAGKSTLMKIMAGLNKPSKGKRSVKFHKKNPIGYVPQQIALFEGLTVKDHINYYQKLTKQTSKEFIEEMVNHLGLKDILTKRIDQLSGGMKRKVNLAVGVIHEPEIIFLDEAFVGVDLATKYDMLKWLDHLNSKGRTIVFITHDWYVINQLKPTMWILDQGRMLDQVNWNSVPYANIRHGSQALQKMFDTDLSR